MSIIVLGWDGLDDALLEEFGLGNAFGTHRKRIDTHVNPVVDDPHTLELWPSMITGLHPDDHGIRAKTEGGGLEWENAIIDLASTYSQDIVPDGILTFLGDKLRKHGVGVGNTEQRYYRNNCLRTVFRDQGGRAISIPNYETPYDRSHNLDALRDELWSALSVESYKDNGKNPQVDLAEVYALLGSEVGKRIGHTVQALTDSEPLIWTWFGLLDSVGHMQPAIGDELVADWYQVAANLTDTVRELAAPKSTVIAISDHGIQEGNHTHYATVCSDNPDAVDAIDHVFDIADWIRSQNIDEEWSKTKLDVEGQAAIQKQLEDLGYI